MGTRPALRAWLRGALRRPARGAVVVVGLAVLTLAVVGALVAADSLDRLFVADARAEWGAVDVEVTSAGAAVFGESSARLVGAQAVDQSDQWAPRIILEAVATAGSRQEPAAQLIGVGAEEQTFGELVNVAGATDLVSLLGMAPDQVVVNARLARRLALAVGDELTVLAVVPEVRQDVAGSDQAEVRESHDLSLPLTVAGIVADRGVADLHRRPSLLVRRDVLQILAGMDGVVTHLHLAAREPDRDGAQRVIRTFESPLREFGLAAAAVKADALDIATDEGGQFRSILLTLALLAIGAAVAATVNLLTAMGHERGRELALLRTLGLPVRGAGRLVLVEALLYTPVGVALGVTLGLPVGSLLAEGLASRFAAIGQGRGREQVDLTLAVEPATLVVAALVVVAAAAWAGRSAGHELAVAPLDAGLRGLSPRRSSRPVGAGRPLACLVAGAALLGMGVTADLAGDALRYLGLTLLLVAGWLWWRRQGGDPAVTDVRASLVALVWSVAGPALLADFGQGYEAGFGILVVAAVVAVSATTVLLVHRLAAVGAVLQRLAPRGIARAALRVAMGEARAAPRRSGTTAAVVGVVLFMVAALNVLGAAAAIDPARQGGGFDVLATSVAPVDPAELAGSDGVERLVTLRTGSLPETAYRVEDDDEVAFTVRYPVRVLPAEDAFIAAQQFGVVEALPDDASATQLLEAVRADTTKVVVDRYARPEGSALGDDVVIDAGSGPRRYELIGVLDTFLLGGVIVAPEELSGLVRGAATLTLASASAASTPQRLAAALEDTGSDQGLDARPMTQVAEDLVAVNRTFTDVFTVMVLLGLVVILGAEAAAVLRAARERRAHLALLRAIGLHRRGIVALLVLERLLLAVLGGAAGALVGLGLLRVLFAVGFSDLAFVVDWARLAAVAGGIALVLGVLAVIAALPGGRLDVEAGLRDLG